MTKIPWKDGYNPKILISIFYLIWTNDKLAYVVENLLGKQKLFERISPKKTIEGFVRWLFFSYQLFGFKILYRNRRRKIFIWIIIAVIVGVLDHRWFNRVQIQTNCRCKRKVVMPGHWGVLDRLDSVIFAATIIFYLSNKSYHVSGLAKLFTVALHPLYFTVWQNNWRYLRKTVQIAAFLLLIIIQF
jgi:phosphatidate cytidylyltransferase